MEDLNLVGRENFKQFLKESNFNSIRAYGQAVLYQIRNLREIEEKRKFYIDFLKVLDDNFGENVRKDVFYIIAKLHKEETNIERAIIEGKDEPETVYDEYEKMCALEDRYDVQERKALKNRMRDLSYYDGHIEDIADYDFYDDNEEKERSTTEIKQGVVYSTNGKIRRLTK